MTGTIPLAKPCLGEAEAEAARATIMSGWVMQGSKVAEFERQFANFVNASHACAVSSGTAALILALKAVGVRGGDVVLTVSHSFIATANAIRACGAEPVFIDIEPVGYNIDPAVMSSVIEHDCYRDGGTLYYKNVERLLNLGESPLHLTKGPLGRVAAILAVHQMGIPCDIALIDSLARHHGIPWVEDAACAIGSEWHGQRIGRPHSAAACFSFHPRKLITTGDGGMVVTESSATDTACRRWRQHGIEPPQAGGHVESYACTAFNYRLTDIQAAVGIEQLARLPELVARRRDRVAYYRACFTNSTFKIPQERPDCYYNWQSLPVDFGGSGLDQMRLIGALASAGITAKPGIMNAHSEMPYAGIWSLPESERRRAETLLLPLFHDLSDGDIERIASELAGLASHA